MNRASGLILVLVLLSACAAPATPAPTIPPTAPPEPAPAAEPSPTPGIQDTLATTAPFFEGYVAAFTAHDADRIVACYSPEVEVYDATENWDHGYEVVDTVFHEYFGKMMDYSIHSWFITPDGRFAVTSGISYSKKNEQFVPSQASLSVFGITGGKITYEFDYYSGRTELPLPLQDFSPQPVQPASQADLQAVTDMATQWQAAFNSRDLEAFLSFYSPEMRVTNAVDYKWKDLDLSGFSEEITALFADPAYQQTMDVLHVSSDVRFVAVQATYRDSKWDNVPMLIILELKDGKIIRQANYLVFS